MILATVACIVSLLALLAAHRREVKTVQWVTKPLASTAFVTAGFLATSPGPASYQSAMLVGMVLGALGDVALMGERKRWFFTGLVLFLLGHLAYVVACATLLPVGAWIGPLALAPVLGGAGALAWLWPRLGVMRVPVIAYVVVIGAMLTGALAVWRGGALPEPRATRLALGALLFWMSDLSVARNVFVAKTFANRAWGLPAYYVGQLLLAWSLQG